MWSVFRIMLLITLLIDVISDFDSGKCLFWMDAGAGCLLSTLNDYQCIISNCHCHWLVCPNQLKHFMTKVF